MGVLTVGGQLTPVIFSYREVFDGIGAARVRLAETEVEVEEQGIVVYDVPPFNA